MGGDYERSFPKRCLPWTVFNIHSLSGGYWEGSPPADITDRMNASFPHHMAVGINQRQAKQIAELDKYARVLWLVMCKF